MGDLAILGRLENMDEHVPLVLATNHHLSLQNNSHAKDRKYFARTGVPSVNIPSLKKTDLHLERVDPIALTIVNR